MTAAWFGRREEKPKEPENPAQMLEARFPRGVRLHPDDEGLRSLGLEKHIQQFPKDGVLHYQSRGTSFMLNNLDERIERPMHNLVRTST